MPDINYGALRLGFDVLQFFGTIALGVYVWASSRHRVTKQRIKELATSVDDDLKDQDHRLTVLETELQHLPGHKDITGLGDKIARLTERLGKLDGRLTGINRAVDLLNEHHLKGGG